jgi:hypothetical protein
MIDNEGLNQMQQSTNGHERVTWAMRPSSGLSSKDTHNPLGFTSISAAPVGTGACLVSRPRGFSVVPELHLAPKIGQGAWLSSRRGDARHRGPVFSTASSYLLPISKMHDLCV